MGSHQSEVTPVYDGSFGVTLNVDWNTFVQYGFGTFIVKVSHPTVEADISFSFEYEAINTYCPTELSAATYDIFYIYLDELEPWYQNEMSFEFMLTSALTGSTGEECFNFEEGGFTF